MVAKVRASAATNDSVNIPKHVKNWGYFGDSNQPPGIPASWVAANMTFAEAGPTAANAFKSAGGQYAVAYTDPIRVIPANHEPMWDTPESGWYHDGSGNRIYYYYSGNGTQNMLNPNSGYTQTAYANYTASLKNQAPYDYVETDNVSWDLLNVFWQYNVKNPVELGSQDNYDYGIEQLLQSSSIPTIVNGFTDADYGLATSGDTMFLPYTSGGIDNEGCLKQTSPGKDENGWVFDENTLLAITHQQKWAVCWPISSVSGDTHVDREFFTASWWLTYDPTWSVSFEGFSSLGSGLIFVFPEQSIVPTQPIQTAQSAVSELKTSTGAYVREFRQCYQAGNAIGPCAAISNPTSGTVSVPSLQQSYSRAIVLDGYNSYTGGQVNWTSSWSGSLAPQTGLILAGYPSSSSSSTPPPTTNSTPPPASGASGNLTGTVVLNTPGMVQVDSTQCGLEPVYYSSSTTINYNGFDLTPGTRIAVNGSGSCSNSYQASTITLASKTGAITITGRVSSAGQPMLVNSQSCGYEDVYIWSNTSVLGTKAAGKFAVVRGNGSCSTWIDATSVEFY